MNQRRSQPGLQAALLVLVVALLLVPATLAGPAAAHTGDDGAHHHDGAGPHGGMWGGGGWWGGWLLGPLLVLLVLVGVPVGLFLALRRGGENGGDVGAGSTDPALETLRERYARGELDDEEFERRRDRLDQG
jgi:putative membrane protein